MQCELCGDEIRTGYLVVPVGYATRSGILPDDRGIHLDCLKKSTTNDDKEKN